MERRDDIIRRWIIGALTVFGCAVVAKMIFLEASIPRELVDDHSFEIDPFPNIPATSFTLELSYEMRRGPIEFRGLTIGTRWAGKVDLYGPCSYAETSDITVNASVQLSDLGLGSGRTPTADVRIHANGTLRGANVRGAFEVDSNDFRLEDDWGSPEKVSAKAEFSQLPVPCLPLIERIIPRQINSYASRAASQAIEAGISSELGKLYDTYRARID